jgi:hypothetical protein
VKTEYIQPPPRTGQASEHHQQITNGTNLLKTERITTTTICDQRNHEQK